MAISGSKPNKVTVDGTEVTVRAGSGIPGVKGDTGSQGPAGTAATVAVGTVTTLSPGSPATVSNSGTAGAAVLDFGIPQGVTGSQGPAGTAATVTVGSVTTGTAGSTATVTNSGTSSAAVLDFTIPRGDKGDTGSQGPQGATGPEGGTSTLTTKGDLLTRTTSAVARLPVGATTGHVLTVDPAEATGMKWAAASGGGGIPATLIDAKGDLIVGSAADTAARLAVGATNGHVLTVDSAQSLGVKWANQTEWAVSRSTFWQVPPYIALPVGTSWPLLSRAYFVPVSLKPGTVITALAINVTATGATGNVVRLGIFSDNGGTPGTILDQSTVAGDSLGVKTWTLSSAFTPTGLFWLAACPQGSGAAGGAWLGSVPVYSMPTTDSAASWGGQSNVAVGFATAASTFTSNPTMTWEQQNRFPYIGMRVQ